MVNITETVHCNVYINWVKFVKGLFDARSITATIILPEPGAHAFTKRYPYEFRKTEKLFLTSVEI